MTISPDPESFSGDAPRFDGEQAINEISAELSMLDVPSEEILSIIDTLTTDPNCVYEGRTKKYSYTVMLAPDGRFILKPILRLAE